jgi:hypothetical protein
MSGNKLNDDPRCKEQADKPIGPLSNGMCNPLLCTCKESPAPPVKTVQKATWENAAIAVGVLGGVAIIITIAVLSSQYVSKKKATKATTLDGVPVR